MTLGGEEARNMLSSELEPGDEDKEEYRWRSGDFDDDDAV
jgi:hypothetical protein